MLRPIRARPALMLPSARLKFALICGEHLMELTYAPLLSAGRALLSSTALAAEQAGCMQLVNLAPTSLFALFYQGSARTALHLPPSDCIIAARCDHKLPYQHCTARPTCPAEQKQAPAFLGCYSRAGQRQAQHSPAHRPHIPPHPTSTLPQLMKKRG